MPAKNITATAVELPSLGASVTEATITRWLKDPGEHVAEGEPLLEVATDKVDTEVPSPATGILIDILAIEDSVVEVGALLATINEASTQSAVTVPGPVVPRTPLPPAAPSSESPAARVTPPAAPSTSDTRTAFLNEVPQPRHEGGPDAARRRQPGPSISPRS